MDRKNHTATVFAGENIKRYVESHGEFLPKDYIQFRKGNDFENHCVFCTKRITASESQPVFFHNQDLHNGIVTTDSETIMCESCLTLVKAGFVKENTEPMATSHLLRYIAERRIDPIRSHYRFTWRKSLLFYKNSDIDTCIFCDGEVGNCNATIYVPVKSYQENKNIHGGHLRVCNSCKDQLNRKLPTHSGLWNLELYPKGCRIPTCSNCNEKYVIEEREYNDRQTSLLATDSNWMCPECAATTQFHSSENSPRFINRSSNGAIQDIPRKIKKTCEYCLDDFHIDATYSNKLMSRYIHSSKHKICTKCFPLKDSLLTPANTRVLHINNYVLVLLEKDHTEWTYSILDMALPTEQQEKEFGHTQTLNLAEVVSIALNYVYRNYSNGNLL